MNTVPPAQSKSPPEQAKKPRDQQGYNVDFLDVNDDEKSRDRVFNQLKNDPRHAGETDDKIMSRVKNKETTWFDVNGKIGFANFGTPVQAKKSAEQAKDVPDKKVGPDSYNFGQYPDEKGLPKHVGKGNPSEYLAVTKAMKEQGVFEKKAKELREGGVKNHKDGASAYSLMAKNAEGMQNLSDRIKQLGKQSSETTGKEKSSYGDRMRNLFDTSDVKDMQQLINEYQSLDKEVKSALEAKEKEAKEEDKNQPAAERPKDKELKKSVEALKKGIPDEMPDNEVDIPGDQVDQRKPIKGLDELNKKYQEGSLSDDDYIKKAQEIARDMVDDFKSDERYKHFFENNLDISESADERFQRIINDVLPQVAKTNLVLNGNSDKLAQNSRTNFSALEESINEVKDIYDNPSPENLQKRLGEDSLISLRAINDSLNDQDQLTLNQISKFLKSDQASMTLRGAEDGDQINFLRRNNDIFRDDGDGIYTNIFGNRGHYAKTADGESFERIDWHGYMNGNKHQGGIYYAKDSLRAFHYDRSKESRTFLGNGQLTELPRMQDPNHEGLSYFQAGNHKYDFGARFTDSDSDLPDLSKEFGRIYIQGQGADATVNWKQAPEELNENIDRYDAKKLAYGNDGTVYGYPRRHLYIPQPFSVEAFKGTVENWIRLKGS